VAVAYAVAVGQQEVVAVEVLLDALQPAAGHGVQPGVHKSDLPVLGWAAVVDGDAARRAEVHGEVGVVEAVIEEVVLDHPALVTQAGGELREALVGGSLPGCTEDGPPPH